MSSTPPPPPPTRGWVRRVPAAFEFIAVGAVTVCFWCFSRWRPGDEDEGFYLLAGQRVMHGELPYLDFSFPQLPGTAYLYGIGQALFGAGMSRGRILPVAMATATLVLVYLAVRRHTGRVAAATSAVLMGANALSLLWLTVAKTHAPALMFAVAASMVTLGARSNGRRAVGGALLALSVFCRATTLPLALPLIWFAGAPDALGPVGTQPVPRARVRCAGWFLLGLVGTLTPLLVLALTAPGRFWFDNVTYHTLYPGGDRSWARVSGVLIELFGLDARSPASGSLGLQNSLLMALVVGCLVAYVRLPRAARRYLVLAGVLALTCFIPVRPASQYFVQCIPFLAIACGIALGKAHRPLLIGASLLCLPAAAALIVRYAAVNSPQRPAAQDEVARAIDALAQGRGSVSSAGPNCLVATRSARTAAAYSQFARIAGSRVPEEVRQQNSLFLDGQLLTGSPGEPAPVVYAAGSLSSPLMYFGLQSLGWAPARTIHGVTLWTRRSAR